jgi:hypothetical protein
VGARNPDRVHISEWRSKAETISDMWKHRWSVRSVCEGCGVERQENLDAMIRLRGPGLVLWDKTGVCQRILPHGGACKGRLFFKGSPPSGAGYDFLGSRPRAKRPGYGPQSRGQGRHVKPEDIEPRAVSAARGPGPPDPE